MTHRRNLRTPNFYLMWALIALVTLVFFQAFRLLILLFTLDLAKGIPLAVLFKSFAVGVRFDLNVTFIHIAPFLALYAALPGKVLEKTAVKRGVKVLFLIPVFGSFFLNAMDCQFLRYFDQRANTLVFQWAAFAKMSLGMIWESFPVVRMFLLLTGLGAAYALCVHFLIEIVSVEDKGNLAARVLWFLFSAFILFLGIRGRVEFKTTLNWSVANFSPYPYANKLALNSAYTFYLDLFTSKKDLHGCLARVPEAFKNRAAVKADSVVFSGTPRACPGAVLVLVESFAARKIKCTDGAGDLAPHFDTLAGRGVLFTRFYSNGAHTFSGIWASLFGLPNPPGPSVMSRPESRQKLGGLAHALKSHGYQTFFFSPHDPHFDNMQGVLYSNGYDRVYGPADYHSRKMSMMGVADGDLYREAATVLEKAGRPFFAVVLTGSNHVPYIVPDSFNPGRNGITDAQKAFLYADRTLNDFIARLRRMPQGDSILVAVTGDHGMPGARRFDVDIDRFHVPFLLLCPAYIPEGRRISEVCGQLDIFPTLMGFLGLSYLNTSFGRDLLAGDTAGATDFSPLTDKEKACGISGKGLFADYPDGKPRYFSFDGLAHAEDSARLAESTYATLASSVQLYLSGGIVPKH